MDAQDNYRNVMEEYLASLKDRQGRELATDVSIGLAALAATQQVVSSSVPGCIPVGTEVTKDMVRTYVLATIVELTEFLQELDWKPWKTKTMDDSQKAKAAEEFADVLAFLGIIIHYMDVLGIDPIDLGEAYRRKSTINVERFLGQHGKNYQQAALVVEARK